MSPDRHARTTAEWVTFGVGVTIVLAIIVAIGVESLRHDEPARPVAVVGATRHAGDHYQVEVRVENRGDEAAAQVQVTASLEAGGETTDADQVVDFLAGGDEENLVFVFADDPDDGELTVEVASFTEP